MSRDNFLDSESGSEICIARYKLHTLISNGCDLTDEYVVALSQQLDQLIVAEQKRRLVNVE